MVAISHKRLRIAMLSIHSSPMGNLGTQNTGGMSVYVRELSKWLGDQGHQVDIFTCANAPEQQIELYPNVRLIYLRIDGAGNCEKAQLPAHTTAIYEALNTYGRDHHRTYDLIHSHYWISTVVGAMAQARWRCPHLTMFHTLGAAKNRATAAENEPNRRMAHERWLAKVVDGIVAPSVMERQNLLCHYHPRPEIIHTIPCGVNLDQFQPIDKRVARKALAIDEDAQMALYVGRFASVKGIDTLIGAVARLKVSVPNLHLVVVGGDGPNAESTRMLTHCVDQHQLAPQVTFAGRIDQNVLPQYYSAADFLALPSHYESFGLVMLEALACGTPVVATPVGAATTLIKEGVNGVVADSSDETALARAIARMLDTPPGSQAAIRATAAAYHWRDVAALLTKTYALLDKQAQSEQSPKAAGRYRHAKHK